MGRVYLTHPCGPWSTSGAIPIVVWCVSGPGIHVKLQSWRTVGQTTNVAEDGVTMSGCGTEYALQCTVLKEIQRHHVLLSCMLPTWRRINFFMISSLNEVCTEDV